MADNKSKVFMAICTYPIKKIQQHQMCNSVQVAFLLTSSQQHINYLFLFILRAP